MSEYVASTLKANCHQDVFSIPFMPEDRYLASSDTCQAIEEMLSLRCAAMREETKLFR